MHGLINRAVQCFMRDTYGEKRWLDVARQAALDPPRFEAMLTYEDAITFKLLQAVSQTLAKPVDDILEDLGTYLVSHPKVEALRRLLRFGGVTFEEFLHSLDDLPDRARLAVPELVLPQLEVTQLSPEKFRLVCRYKYAGFGPVMMGVLRTMADDYGALVFLDMETLQPGEDILSITLVEASYAEGRHFELGLELE